MRSGYLRPRAVAGAPRRGAAAEADEATGARAITLGQRAFPLLEMLEAARRKQVEVTWGI